MGDILSDAIKDVLSDFSVVHIFLLNCFIRWCNMDYFILGN